jgi:hypothetical protein
VLKRLGKSSDQAFLISQIGERELVNLGTTILSTQLLKGFVKDWKTYSETGLVSDTKKRELVKI